MDKAYSTEQMETNEVLLQIIRKLHEATKEDVDILSAYEDCEEKAKMLPVAKFFFKFGLEAAKDIVRSYLPEDIRVSDVALDEAEGEGYGDIVKETDNHIEYVIAQTYSPVDFCSYGKCPICGETVSGFFIGSPNLCDKECPKCGQKLKWR